MKTGSVQVSHGQTGVERSGKGYRELGRGMSIVMGARVLGAGGSFGLGIAIARILGASGSGVYYLARSLTDISAVLAQFGFDSLLLVVGRGRQGQATAGSPQTLKVALRFSFIVGSLLFVAAWAFGGLADAAYHEASLRPVLLIMAVSIPAGAWVNITGAYLKAVDRLASAAALVGVSVSATALPLMLVLARGGSVGGAALAWSIANWTAAIAGLTLVRRHSPGPWGPVVWPQARALASRGARLMALASMYLILRWSDILVLGLYRDANVVGVYGTVSRIVNMMGFMLTAADSVVVPEFSGLIESGRIEALQHLLRRTGRLLFLASTVVLGSFAVLGHQLLGLFGRDFVQGYSILLILASGQFVNVSTGSVGFLLISTRQEKTLQWLTLAGAAGNIALNLMLVPRFGGVGAAISTALSIAAVNIGAVTQVHRSLGINTLPFGRMRRVIGGEAV